MFIENKKEEFKQLLKYKVKIGEHANEAKFLGLNISTN